MPDPMDLINRMAAQQQAARGQMFLAPLLPRTKARLRIAGLVAQLRVRAPRAGWYICRVINDHQAEVVHEAGPYERGEYLKLLPELRMVLVERVGESTDWLAVAFNGADAFQRFRLAGPVVVHLVDGHQPFDRIVARVEGDLVWYEDWDARADGRRAEELREALDAREVQPSLRDLAPGELVAYALLVSRRGIIPPAPVVASPALPPPPARPTTRAVPVSAATANPTEAWLRSALTMGGGTLLGYDILASGEIVVRWEQNGQHRPSIRLNEQGDVVSSGICLSGRDRVFDLTSVVGVIRDSPSFARQYGGWYDDDDD